MTLGYTRVDVLGVPLTPCTVNEAVDRVGNWVHTEYPSYATFTGVHGVMEAQRKPDVLRAHQGAGVIAPDGAPMVWASRFAGIKIAARVTGREFMAACCERAAAEGWTSFIYGGKPGRAEELADILRDRYPGIKIVGTYTPPFRPLTPAEDADMVAQINASGASLVWVGLSTPKQELWMAEHRGLLQAPALLGVGAAIDYIAGELSEAPRWMQRAGLEWAYRLMLEPKRLASRYFRNNPAFIAAILRNRPSVIAGEDARDEVSLTRPKR
jgi:N-acetylglucosaminyldiphosphoundecaprenol N-acetyl-beta-D-mannosaminyltransferase